MKQWRWIASHRIVLHGLHRIASHGMAWHGMASHCIALHCIALHHIALDCIALLCIEWHRMASHGMASHRIASHRIVMQQWQQFGTGSAYRAGDAAMENGPATADGLGNQACDEDDEEACAVRTELEALVAHIQHQVFAPSGRTGRSVPRVCRVEHARDWNTCGRRPWHVAGCWLRPRTRHCLFQCHVLHAVT